MNDFTYVRASDVEAAVSLLAEQRAAARFLAGGTNLVDLMREGVERPEVLVDITRAPLAEVQELPDGGLRIGAMVRNSHLAGHPLVRQRYPLLSQAILHGASAQLRNMATTGGNIMQRTRCCYFYDISSQCNKRTHGSGCDAMNGYNRMHAVLGTSAHCIAAHPSDMCVAMAALDAKVNVRGRAGERTIAFGEFHLLPGDTPQVETSLAAGELITSIDLPAPTAGLRSIYRKVRDRASYAFALVAVAAAIRMENGVMSEVRLALGGLATKPWRATIAEQLLRGAAPSPGLFAKAAEAELAPAVVRSGNAFKPELTKRTIEAVLAEITGTEGDLQ